MSEHSKPDLRQFSRRTVLKGMAASSVLALMGANMMGCGSNGHRSYAAISEEATVSFSHGVASGDPLQDRVILWTRAQPSETGRVDLSWQVATNANFDAVVRSGEISTNPDVDYTVKVDVSGLSSNTTYYYRFMYKNTVSAIGQTKTLPSGSIAQVSFAVFSCANYPAGYFHVYREALQSNEEVNYDAVIHLGDYLYEYAMGDYATEDAEALGRVPAPTNETVSLSDYRTRYAQYRSDENLQELHRVLPFILVWDDHEVANDAWNGGAENHNSEAEGDYADRKLAALQAYYEWLPIRPPQNLEEIYRSFQFGDLVDLIMLDTRLVGRDQQVVFADFTTEEVIDSDAVNAAAEDSTRSMLGTEQKTWLLDQLAIASSRWQVLGQQVLMGRMQIPTPILQSINAQDVETGKTLITQAVTAKLTPEDSRSVEQQALLDERVPYNLDAWDGYAAEREELLNAVAQNSNKLVVLAGDTHNAWANNLKTANGTLVGIELATSSVSSPGFDDYLSLDEATAGQFAQALPILVDDLVYTNMYNRGFMEVTFSQDQVTSRWLYVDTVKNAGYQLATARTTLYQAAWDTLQLTKVTI